MKRLNENEIARTAFMAIPKERWNSPFGYTHPNRDKNEMCPYCKNEDTDVVRDAESLEPFEAWYAGRVEKYTVVNCRMCSAVWSFFAPLERNNALSKQGL